MKFNYLFWLLQNDKENQKPEHVPSTLVIVVSIMLKFIIKLIYQKKKTEHSFNSFSGFGSNDNNTDYKPVNTMSKQFMLKL